MSLNLEKYNAAVKEWDRKNNADIIKRALGYSIIHRAEPASPSPKPSLQQFRSKQFQQDGAINKVTKTFPRSLIYTHKGAGKGRGGVVGSRWTDRYGRSKTTNPTSYGKMGTSGRKAKPFINDALEAPDGVDELATIVAEHLGDALVNNLFIK